MKLFKKRLELTQKKQVLQERIDLLIDDITESFYINICRGLFEKDKLLYSFLIASKIMIYDKKINPVEWNFFLRGGSGDPVIPETIPKFLNEKTYRDFVNLSETTATFKSILNEIKNPNNAAQWAKIYESENPS